MVRLRRDRGVVDVMDRMLRVKGVLTRCRGDVAVAGMYFSLLEDEDDEEDMVRAVMMTSSMRIGDVEEMRKCSMKGSNNGPSATSQLIRSGGRTGLQKGAPRRK